MRLSTRVTLNLILRPAARRKVDCRSSNKACKADRSKLALHLLTERSPGWHAVRHRPPWNAVVYHVTQTVEQLTQAALPLASNLQREDQK